MSLRNVGFGLLGDARKVYLSATIRPLGFRAAKIGALNLARFSTALLD